MNIPASSSRVPDAAGTSSSSNNINIGSVLQNVSQGSSSQTVAEPSKCSTFVPPKDEKAQQMYLIIYKFLQQQLEENENLNAVQKESLEVVVNCLGYAFQVFDFDYVEHTLPEVYDFFEKNKQDLDKKEVNNDMDDDECEIPPEDIVQADDFKENGNKLMREQKFQEALELYEKAVRLNPKEPALYCNRAAAYNKLNRYNDAIDDCNTALALNSSYAKAYIRRGLAYEQLKDNKRALKSYKKAHLLEPHNEDYKNLYTEASKRFKQRQDESTSTSSTSFSMFYGPNMEPLGPTPFGQQLPEFNNLMESLFSNVERQWSNQENPDSNNRDNPSYFS